MDNSKPCALSVIYTCNAIETKDQVPVGRFRLELGEALGEDKKDTFPKDLDCVVPIPQSGMYYAMGLAKVIEVPYLQAIVKWDEKKRTLSTNQDMRKATMTKELILIPQFLEGRKIILVDEAIFTGLTIKLVCENLREHGVGEIHICIPTAPCIHPCPALPKRDLISSRMSIPEMVEYFGADSLTFQSEEVFDRHMKKQYQSFCVDCFLDR